MASGAAAGRRATDPVRRLPHGYTNSTVVQGHRVVKTYLGPEAADRSTREVNALTFLAGKLAVPRLIEHDPSRIVTRLIEGTPGQELIELLPDEVLFETGRTARALHRLDLSRSYGTQHDRSVLVHGDFGPQNMLFASRRMPPTAVAVVDWEHAHVGDPVEDLAWAEWIVRTHHPHLVRSVGSIFEGYGRRPTWAQRHAAMLAKCRWALDFVGRWTDGHTEAAGVAAAVAMWQARLDATAAFRE